MKKVIRKLSPVEKRRFRITCTSMKNVILKTNESISHKSFDMAGIAWADPAMFFCLRCSCNGKK